jgi:spermidine/putrescine transport system permease protein
MGISSFKLLSIAVISAWLIVFAAFPNILVTFVSFLTRDEARLIVFEPTFSNYTRLLDPIYLKVFINSVKIALFTTVLCMLLAFPFSYALSLVESKYKNILVVFIIVPFWTSALIRTYAVKTLLTTNGLINKLLMKFSIIDKPLDMLYTQGAVALGLVYTLLPFMILPLYATLEKLDKRLIEAASDLGASSFNTLIRVIIPLSVPGLIAGGLLVFLPALGLFYIPDILGGAKTLMLGNLVKSQFLDARDWPFGSAVSIVLTAIMAVLLLINYRTIKLAGKRGIL